MIEDIRCIIRYEPDYRYAEDGSIVRRVNVLQAYDGHVWFDVPVVEIEEEIAQQNQEAASVSQNELRELGVGDRRKKPRE